MRVRSAQGAGLGQEDVRHALFFRDAHPGEPGACSGFFALSCPALRGREGAFPSSISRFSRPAGTLLLSTQSWLVF